MPVNDSGRKQSLFTARSGILLILMNSKQVTLQFTDYLRKLPPAWVLEHFFDDTKEQRKILSSAMIEEAAAAFATADELQNRLSMLDEEQQVRCAQMYLLGTSGVFSDDNAGLEDPIVSHFLGYAARDAKGLVRVFPFSEFEPLLRSALVGILIPALAHKTEGAPSSQWSWRCCTTVTLFVALAAQHLLIRKKNGKLGMAALQQIKKLVHLGDLKKSDDVNVLTEVILDYCTVNKLLFDNESEYTLNAPAFDEWLLLPLREREEQLIDFIIENGGGWSISLLRDVSTRADNQWLTSAGFDDEDQPILRKGLIALQLAGIVDVRKAGNHLLFTGVEKMNVSDDTPGQPVVIMPDFTIIIPQETRPATLFIFSRFCKVLSLDRVYHGCIEKSVLTEALSAGLEGERILEALRKWNAPDNVRESVREWIREFNRLSLATGSVLIASEQSVTEQVDSLDQLEPYLEKVPVHTVYRIRPGSEHIVRDIVRKYGFDERMPQSLHSAGSDEDDVETLLAADAQESEWTVIVEDNPEGVKPVQAFRGTKYGAELKELELSEVVQVID
ncbi:MAG: hypothetical protein OQK82_02135, partial [Candidatus Pacearchaeota archaeon]|nr:hypothetical protein [Candidatus Pacearchaeota archaeon]